MFWYNLKSFAFFLICAVVVGAATALAYFKSEIHDLFPNLFGATVPTTAIPLIAGAVIAIIFFILWRKQIENDRSRAEFVSIITHKFRTPLTGVKWAIEMLRNNNTEQQKQDILAHMENSNQRLMEIVDLMVGFAQFDKHLDYAYEASSLREMADVSLQKYGDQIRAKNINFHIKSVATLPLVITDKRKIQFVVDMLIDNAIKYTPVGGMIDLDFSQDKNFLILSVHDTGIGISPADQSHVFKRFYRSSNAKTAHTEGMGLGLYTAKAIIKKHGGRIWFTSKGVGQGTTFYIALKIKS